MIFPFSRENTKKIIKIINILSEQPLKLIIVSIENTIIKIHIYF
jgi:hypothetical protein